jgi:hypothetical protein
MNPNHDNQYASGEGTILIEIRSVFSTAGPGEPRQLRPTRQYVRETYFGVDGEPDRVTTSEVTFPEPQ